MARVGRIAEDDHDGLVALDGVGRARLACDLAAERGQGGSLRLFQRVGEEDVEPFVEGHLELAAVQFEGEVEMADGVGGHL